METSMKKMTLTELTKNYSFHDSSIETVVYDKEKQTLSFRICFSTYWKPMFENYPDVIPVSLVFNGVKEYSGILGSFECYGIINEILKDKKTVVFCIMDDLADNTTQEGYYEIEITADSVEFTVLDPTGKEYL